MIRRKLDQIIEGYLMQKKAVLLFGARQVGKTTLLNSFSKRMGLKTIFLNGDEPDIKALLSDYSSQKLRMIFGNSKLVVIDEAQNIGEIGTLLKVIVDYIPEIQVIASGSSSFELANRASEPLTGRKFEFVLYPLSFSEMVEHHGFVNEYSLLENRMIYGYYPEIVSECGKEEKRLKSLAGSYLYKDLLMLEQIKRPKLIDKILRALALQVGNEVSYHEIGQLVGADSITVEKYIDYMEQAFIVFRLPALSRNVRNEIKKGKKIYFFDNGIRNAVLGNFLPLNSRSDLGALWENFLISERKKFLNNEDIQANSFFWRTTQQQEIDYIEERNGDLYAYEFKWSDGKNHKFSETFTKNYNVKSAEVVNRENFYSFIHKEINL
ncbi:MAG TPA: ATP-binding protein [Tenuifilaceae bacterium]|nr:ATP-binding protein [Tenuifilaceae bacterium]